MLGERGHDVVVIEAADVPGGQVRLAAAAARRRDLIGIVDWRVAEAKHTGVEFRYGVLADADLVRAERPDVVVVATGGVPNRGFLQRRGTWSRTPGTSWAGAAHPQGSGPRLRRQRRRAGAGRRRAPGRPAAPRSSWSRRSGLLGPLVGSMNSPAYLRAFAEHGVTRDARPPAHRGPPTVTAAGCVAHLRSEYADLEVERPVDHVVVEHGTLPNRRRSTSTWCRTRRNGGAVDHGAAARRREPQTGQHEPGRRVPAVPDRRRRRQPQHPRRHLRRAASLPGHLNDLEPEEGHDDHHRPTGVTRLLTADVPALLARGCRAAAGGPVLHRARDLRPRPRRRVGAHLALRRDRGRGAGAGRLRDRRRRPVLGVVAARRRRGGAGAAQRVPPPRVARILTERAGSVGNIVCGYHQWTYATDGSPAARRRPAARLRQGRLRPQAGPRPGRRGAGVHLPGAPSRPTTSTTCSPRSLRTSRPTSSRGPRSPPRSTWSRRRTGSWCWRTTGSATTARAGTRS